MTAKKLKRKYRDTLRTPLNRRNRSRLRNDSPSIVANNCNGGIIMHDLGLRFNTPTVNLYIPFPDYIRFLQGLGHYLTLQSPSMVEGPLASEGCPTGLLEDIRLVFVHYASFEDARDKWFERAARVDMSNLFVMLAMRDGCTVQDVQAFDNLPFEHKVAFVDRPMPDVACARYLPEFVSGGVASRC